MFFFLVLDVFCGVRASVAVVLYALFLSIVVWVLGR